MFTISIGHDVQELSNFRIKRVEMIEFGYRLEARRCIVCYGVISR